MASHRRVQRLNQLLREELSRLIRRELQDPRVEMVTVTEVDVSGDLRHAKVFVRTLRDLEPGTASEAEEGEAPDTAEGDGPAGTDAEAAADAEAGEDEAAADDAAGDADEDGGEGDEDRDALREALDGLRSAEGFLRGVLGRELRLRRIPELHFRADRTLERARRIEDLLDRISTPGEEDDGGA